MSSDQSPYDKAGRKLLRDDNQGPSDIVWNSVSYRNLLPLRIISLPATILRQVREKMHYSSTAGFEHVYGDIISGVIDIKELGFLVKDMDSMVRKMERYVNSTVRLYREMEVMNELESATKKFQQNQHEESRKAFEQKLIWQRQDVRHLKDVSLWNRTFDKVVELLARTVCTVYARIYIVFGDGHLRGTSNTLISKSQIGFTGSLRRVKQEFGQKSGQLDVASKVQKDTSLKKSISTKSNRYCHSGPIVNKGFDKRTNSFRPNMGLQKSEGGLFGPEDFNFACGIGPGRLFMECLSLSSSASKVDDDDDDQSSQTFDSISIANSAKSDNTTVFSSFVRPINVDPLNGGNRQFLSNSINGTKFQPKSRLLVYAPPKTVGGSALALHYANVIIVIEKLLRYPHLVGDEARDDLYQMLPTTLRKTLKAKLKSYTKDLAIYDAPLAHDWRERLGAMLMWLAPLAHNMIKWQSERNFEQHQIVTRTNVLLLQTLYFADREKTEEVICEVLVGLNYICRYEQQQNALLDCASSFDFDDCMDWQSQIGASIRS
ncbi:hypothetical protein DH2020_019836 [Rehmannia glutinosa]|uniref:DUF668 domain-containing protein n=1 Tax=Rehmannia glutinosa TaxID=99300 RepID=A0ABR0WEC9_REHGL